MKKLPAAIPAASASDDVDHALREMTERYIRECKKKGYGASIILSSLTHHEFRRVYPSWAGLSETIDKDQVRINLRIRRKDFQGTAAQLKCAEATANLLTDWERIHRNMSDLCLHLLQRIIHSI
jgi:hypothetical protein